MGAELWLDDADATTAIHEKLFVINFDGTLSTRGDDQGLAALLHQHEDTRPRWNKTNAHADRGTGRRRGAYYEGTKNVEDYQALHEYFVRRRS